MIKKTNRQCSYLELLNAVELTSITLTTWLHYNIYKIYSANTVINRVTANCGKQKKLSL